MKQLYKQQVDWFLILIIDPIWLVWQYYIIWMKEYMSTWVKNHKDPYAD